MKTGYENKIAVVVELGNSGCDAAVELLNQFLLKSIFISILHNCWKNK
jgi:hypothetical protein